MILDKGGCVAEGIKRLHGPFLLVFVTFGTADLLTCGERFRMGIGQTRNGLHLGTGGEYQDKSD